MKNITRTLIKTRIADIILCMFLIGYMLGAMLFLGIAFLLKGGK